MQFDSINTHAHRVPKPLIAAVACLVGLIAAILATHTGVDLLLVAALCVAVIATERTVGDWLGELIGPSASTASLAGCAVLAGWYMFNGGGRPTTEKFFATAAEHGYTTIWFQSSTARRTSRRDVGPYHGVAAAPLPPDTSIAANAAPVATSSDSNSAAVAVDGTGVARAKTAWRGVATEPQGTVNSLTVSPPLAAAGQPIVLRAAITTHGEPVRGGSVDFVVNGRHIATVAVGADGVASTEFSARVPGGYTIGAHFTGAQTRGRVSSQASLTIVP
jgi:Bacterial Ig-like domain (group 3)